MCSGLRAENLKFPVDMSDEVKSIFVIVKMLDHFNTVAYRATVKDAAMSQKSSASPTGRL